MQARTEIGGTQAPAHPQLASSGLRPWYVILSKPRQENYACMRLLEQGYEAYLPMLQQWARRAGDWVHKSQVMFPRYAFVRPSVPEQSVGPIRSTPGVTTIVRFGPVLACLSAERVQALRDVETTMARKSPKQPFEAGAAVVFTAGPLKGLSGIVSGVAAQRVQVMLTLLGQDQKISTAGCDLALA